MLTREIIILNPALKGLSDDQIKAIETLSKNDEDTVVGAALGNAHGKYDEMFSKTFGVQKPNGVKSYEFWNAEAEKIKAKADKSGDNTETEKLKTQIADLETKLKDGKGDEAIRAKLAEMEKTLKDKDTTITDLRGKLDTTDTKWKAKLEEAQKSATMAELDGVFAQSLQGVKFKDTIPESLQKLAIQNAKAAILNEYQPDKIDNGQGGKRFVFRKEGVIQNNKENSLNPFTPGEMLLSKLTEVIDTGKKQAGAGTKAGAGNNNGGGSAISIAGAKSKAEVMDLVKNQLMTNGVAVTDPKYQKTIDEAWKEAEAAGLPLK